MTRVGGDVDYDLHGAGYAEYRRADPRIAAHIHEALGAARTVLNVGAGAGSYEPDDRDVIPVEPSAAMRRQRPEHRPTAIAAVAERLPFEDRSVDAAMALVTVHQWRDVKKGLQELRRVARGAVVVMTFDPDWLAQYWLAQYVPDLIDIERRRFPTLDLIRDALGGTTQVRTLPIPSDCSDGFAEAYYARPEKFLESGARRAQSAWSFLNPAVETRFVRTLREELESGRWEDRFGDWRRMPSYEGSLCLVVSESAA